MFNERTVFNRREAFVLEYTCNTLWDSLIK